MEKNLYSMNKSLSDGECIAISGDFKKQPKDGVKKLVSEITTKEKHIDVLVNNVE